MCLTAGEKIRAAREFACAISVGIEAEFLRIDKPKGHDKLYLNDITLRQGKENKSVLNVEKLHVQLRI